MLLTKYKNRKLYVKNINAKSSYTGYITTKDIIDLVLMHEDEPFVALEQDLKTDVTAKILLSSLVCNTDNVFNGEDILYLIRKYKNLKKMIEALLKIDGKTLKSPPQSREELFRQEIQKQSENQKIKTLLDGLPSLDDDLRLPVGNQEPLNKIDITKEKK